MSDVPSELSGLHWEASLQVLHDASSRRAWLVAGTSAGISVLCLLAVLLLVPLKQTIPYVISVDKATGQSEILSLAANQTGQQQVLEAKYWLAQYVRTRERLDRESLANDFAAVVRLSGHAEAALYKDSIKALLDDEHQGKTRPSIRVEILSIGMVDLDHAVVRFQHTPISPTGVALPASQATATLTFSIAPHLLGRERDLIENPLGFQVQSYRVDQDLIELESKP